MLILSSLSPSLCKIYKEEATVWAAQITLIYLFSFLIAAYYKLETQKCDSATSIFLEFIMSLLHSGV